MPTSLHSFRWFHFATLACSIALAGCGGDASSIDQQGAAATAPAPVVPVITRDGATTEQTTTIAAPELANTRDRATIDASATQVQHDVEQTTGAVTQAVGEAQTQAKEAASDAVGGAKGFVAELRDDATQSVNSAVSQAKTSAQGAADGARQQARTAVADAQENIRRRAKAAADNAAQQAQAAETKALNNLLGPAPKN